MSTHANLRVHAAPWIAIIEKEHFAAPAEDTLSESVRCACCRWTMPCPSLRLVELILRASGDRAEEGTPERTFPIQAGTPIPWTVIQPFAYAALREHGQTLERLAERGGLGAAEALIVLNDRQWCNAQDSEAQRIQMLPTREANEELRRLVAQRSGDHSPDVKPRIPLDAIQAWIHRGGILRLVERADATHALIPLDAIEVIPSETEREGE